MNSFLVLPACEQGRGGGHLYRSISLVKSLRTGGADAWLFSEKAADLICDSELWLDKEKAYTKNWTLVILDRFRTEQKTVQQWAEQNPVLGIDEGLSRKECDFLIDLLPNLFTTKNNKANLCAPSLLPLPQNQRPSFNTYENNTHEKAATLKILVSFGAEDAAGLTVTTALALKNITGQDCSLSVVLGPLRKNNDTDRKTLEDAGITVIEGKNQSAENCIDLEKREPGSFCLQEMLADYDLLITHFGITAFEALHARVPVLLINPSPYHEQLSRHAGLPFISRRQKFSFFSSHGGTETQRSIGIFRIPHHSPCLSAFVRGNKEKIDFEVLYKKCVTLSENAACRWGLENVQKPETLAVHLLTAQPVVHRHCPLCGAPAVRLAGRFPGRTYRLCRCGTITMDRLSPPPVEYNRDYFFTDYQKQYGKTYLDDFPKLQKDGLRRMHIICTLLDLKRNAPKVLDIGCAYGPFLAAAQESGFDAMGIDPAPDAVVYVKETLGINAVLGTFPESIETGVDRQFYDVITLWYVIEHFEDPGKILTVINSLLKTGGVLAFSTPSAAGISRRRSLNKFLENSPADHWTIWDPRRVKRILTRYGFRQKKRVITGLHPERFPLAKTLHGNVWGRFFDALSRMFGLGDTFECYAVKVRDCEHT